ncbi:MAG: NAD(P)-dependent oxidoreductase [Firmicutes bacterium]|nr:NAD(P)-dependent oxidoreductase [Bacillota bacterium]MBO2521297.1 NAD(P)-dependent oxidoreductase [Bacillota bacterium]
MKFLVTGATGQLGSLVVERLLQSIAPERLAVSVRDPGKAEALRRRGVDVRRGDFDHPETLAEAFAGAERMLLISTTGDNETRIRQHRAAVAAAKAAGVRFIAYTSLAKADSSPLSLAEVHRATEEAIRESGIAYSFLRNNWYLENELGTIQAVMGGAPWITSAGAGRVGWAPRKDYADAAAAVLMGEGHENTVYELSGKPLSYDQLAAEVAAVLGREIRVEHVDDETYARALKDAGVPEPLAAMFTGVQQAIRQGALDVESQDFEKVLGRPLTPIQDALRAILPG